MPPDSRFVPGEPLAAGRLVGGTWEIERPLGAGGMGAVYVARNVRTGRRYAVKALLESRVLSPDGARRFRREAQALGALGHAGIIGVHDYGETEDGIAFIVMDLLEGEDLSTRLAHDGALRWPEARRILLEVADALGAAHAVGILHRDLKPGNIFLARQAGAPERAVLLDFGLAKLAGVGVQSQITSSGAVLGTPLYMAPEQARGDELDGRADLYALGVVLYEMVTGVAPFQAPTVTGVLARLLTDPPPLVTTAARTPVPPQLDAILQRALAKRPAARFQTAAELAAAVASVGEAAALTPAAQPGEAAPATGWMVPLPAPAPLMAAQPVAPVAALPAPAPVLAAPPAPMAVAARPVAATTAARARPHRLALVALPLALAALALGAHFGWRALRRAPDAGRGGAGGAAVVVTDAGPASYLDLRVATAHAARDWRRCLDVVPATAAGHGTLQTQVNCAFQQQDVAALGRVCAELQRRFPDDVATPSCRRNLAQLEALLATPPAPPPGPGAAAAPGWLAAPGVPAAPRAPAAPGRSAAPGTPDRPTAAAAPPAPAAPGTGPALPPLPPPLAEAAAHQAHARYRECLAAARRGPPTEQALNWQFGCAVFVSPDETKRVCAETGRRLPPTHAFVTRCRSYLANLEAARAVGAP